MIDINIFNLVGVAYLGCMVAYDFLPLQPAKRWFIRILPFSLSSLADKLLNCSKCCATWIGLGIYHDITYAALAGLTAVLINFVMDFIKDWYAG